ncbi:MAG: hypothetical protein QM775_35670 [Pirellulales bacterium]
MRSVVAPSHPAAPKATAEMVDVVRLLEARDHGCSADYWQAALADRPEVRLPLLREARATANFDEFVTGEIAYDYSAADTADRSKRPSGPASRLTCLYKPRGA